MIKEIANGAQALKIYWILWVFFKVFPQADDEVVHGSRRCHTGIPPAYLQEYLARQGFPAVGYENLQQSCLLFSEVNQPLSAIRRHLLEINGIAIKGVLLRICRFFRCLNSRMSVAPGGSGSGAG